MILTELNFDELAPYIDQLIFDETALDTDSIYQAKLLLRKNQNFEYIAIRFNGDIYLSNENNSVKLDYARILVFDSSEYLVVTDKYGNKYEADITDVVVHND